MNKTIKTIILYPCIIELSWSSLPSAHITYYASVPWRTPTKCNFQYLHIIHDPLFPIFASTVYPSWRIHIALRNSPLSWRFYQRLITNCSRYKCRMPMYIYMCVCVILNPLNSLNFPSYYPVSCYHVLRKLWLQLAPHGGMWMFIAPQIPPNPLDSNPFTLIWNTPIAWSQLCGTSGTSLLNHGF